MLVLSNALNVNVPIACYLEVIALPSAKLGSKSRLGYNYELMHIDLDY